MLSFDARGASRQELYRDLVYGTAELVSRSLPMDELLESAVDLAKSFFNASALEIRLRNAGLTHSRRAAIRHGTGFDVEEAACEVMRTGVALRAPDATSMHVPIRFGNDVRGAISIVASDGTTFDDVDASLFEKWGSLLGVRIAELHLRADNARLEVLAGIDGLTGICNRRAFGDMLAPACERASRSGTSLAIAMIDVDFFKSFNDKYGHVAGDTTLKQIAKTISLSLREGDVLGRYGGEEFAIFCEGASLGAAIEVAERLRENIYALGIPHLGSRLGRVTASVGVAAVVPRAGDDASALIERADAALYGAKERGRNRVVADAYVSASSAALPRQDVRSNLPRPVSSFCGRHDDAARVRAALAQSRLVTVTGFGGVGKTRLALEVPASWLLLIVMVYGSSIWPVRATQRSYRRSLHQRLRFVSRRRRVRRRRSPNAAATRKRCCSWTIANISRAVAPCSPQPCCIRRRRCASWRPAAKLWTQRKNSSSGWRRSRCLQMRS